MYLTTVNRLPFYGPITKFKCYKLTIIIICCIIAIYALVLGKIIEAIYMIPGHLLLYYFYHIIKKIIIIVRLCLFCSFFFCPGQYIAL